MPTMMLMKPKKSIKLLAMPLRPERTEAAREFPELQAKRVPVPTRREILLPRKEVSERARPPRTFRRRL